MTDKTTSISEQNFSKLLYELEDAFNYILSEKASIAYWRWLKDIPEAKLEKEISEIILTEHKFPSIARLYQAKRKGEVVL